MKIVFISDVHSKFNKIEVPKSDILISCGDYSFKGESHEVRNFHHWLNKQDATHIISVQGNHEKGVERDFGLSKQMALEKCPKVHFIDEGLIEIGGFKIWCSAITPYFHNWAWNRYRGDDIKKHWDKIPLDIDILVTHGPPMGVLDQVERFNGPKCEWEIENVGCRDLLDKIQQLKQLRVHAFGHIHSGYGVIKAGDITYINASICDEQYRPINKPIVFEL